MAANGINNSDRPPSSLYPEVYDDRVRSENGLTPHNLPAISNGKARNHHTDYDLGGVDNAAFDPNLLNNVASPVYSSVLDVGNDWTRNGGKINVGFDNNEGQKPAQPHLKEEPTIVPDDDDDDESDDPGQTKKKKKGDEDPPASLRSLFRFATGFDWLLMFIGSALALAHGFAFPFLAIVFGNMVNTLKPQCPPDYPIPANTTIGEGDLTPKMCAFINRHFPKLWDECGFNDQMNEQVLKYTYIGLAVMVASFIHVLCYLSSCERQMFKLRRTFLRQILRQDLPFFDKHQSGELTSRLADDMERVREGTGDKIGFMVQLFAQFVGGFAIGFYYNWKLTLAVMSLTPLTAVSFAILGKAISSSTTKEQRAYAKAGGLAEEVLSTIKIVLAFNGQHKARVRYDEKLAAAQAFAVRKSIFIGVGLSGFMLSVFGSYAVALWVGSILVENGEIDSGRVYTVLFAVMTGAFGIGGAAPHITSFFTAKASAGSLYAVIDRVPAVDALDESHGIRDVVIQGDVELRNVEFAYPTKPDMPVLKGISLHAKRGETIALVGNSGCGKSTIVNLIERFYDVQNGQVLVDGRDVRDYNVRTLRSQLGLVSQLPVLFGFTIEENIKLGRDDTISDDDMIEACKTANIHSFIMSLPKKYKTLVGDKGAQLSGGQRQRVAVARAIVMKHVPILLLDEATSALDTESETLVQAALEKASATRTTIVIAHRLSTIKNANTIHVVDKGQIVESGTHDQLMEQRGEYYELVQMQRMRSEGDAAANPNGGENSTNNVGKKPKHIFRQQSSSFDVMKARPSVGDVGANVEAGKEPQTPSSPTKHTMFGTKKEDIEDAERKLDLEGPLPSFWQIFRYNAPELPLIVIGFLFGSTINGAAMPVFSLFFGQMFSVLNLRGYELHHGVLIWALAFAALGVSQAISNFNSTYFFSKSGEGLTRRLRYKVFDNILRQDLTFFDSPKHSPGKLTTRLATDASAVKTATGLRIGIIGQSITALLTAFVIGMIYGWKFCLCLVAIMPLLLVSGYFSLRIHTGNQKKDSKAMEEAGNIATEAIENVATVQALTREMYIHQKFCHALEAPHRQNMRRAYLYALAFSFSQALVFFTYAGAFKLGAYFITTCDLMPANMFKVFFAITFVAVMVGQWGSMLPEYSKAQLSAGLIFGMLRTQPKIDSYAESGKRHDIQGAIEFRNVSFRYPERSDMLVLDNVSFRVEPGQSLGIVGPSGSGKSTIVALLERFYDPDNVSTMNGGGETVKVAGGEMSGKILIDGVDLREYNLQHYRRQVALVLQEPLLFKTSFQENIAYGIDDSDKERSADAAAAHGKKKNVELDMPRIVHAAKEANIHDYIMTLPKQYQESVGDRGSRLSGGQRQRVTISRAIVRRPKILLLDEATSALDSQSEHLVQAALERAVRGVTSVIIAHRLSTLKQTDKILVLDKGRVVEEGNQDELLQKEGGLYRQLCQVQDVK